MMIFLKLLPYKLFYLPKGKQESDSILKICNNLVILHDEAYKEFLSFISTYFLFTAY